MSFFDIPFDIKQEDWGHTHPYAFVRHIPQTMEVHHAVVPTDRFDSIRHAKNIQAIHIGKGWNGAFYNVGVHSKTGEIVELRGVGNRSTSLAPDALTVVLFGDHHSYPGHETPDIISNAAIASLLKIAALAPKPKELRGHRERPYATACPGSYAMAHFVLPYREGEFFNSPPKEVDILTPELKARLDKIDADIAALSELNKKQYVATRDRQWNQGRWRKRIIASWKANGWKLTKPIPPKE